MQSITKSYRFPLLFIKQSTILQYSTFCLARALRGSDVQFTNDGRKNGRTIYRQTTQLGILESLI